MTSNIVLEQGQVVKLLSANKVQIKVPRKSACESCVQKSFCHPFGRDHMLIEALNPIQARPGQEVEIKMALENPKKAVAILYLIPLLALIIGAVLGNSWDPFGHKDASAVVFSLGFLILSYAGIQRYSRSKSLSEPEDQPTVNRIIADHKPQPPEQNE